MNFFGAFEGEALYSARDSRIGFWTGLNRERYNSLFQSLLFDDIKFI